MASVKTFSPSGAEGADMPLNDSVFDVELNPALVHQVAVALMNGSNLAAGHPFRTEQGMVRLFRRRGTRLTLVDEQLVGAVPEGVAFTNDGRYLVVQNYVARTLGIFRVAGDKLHPTGHVVELSGQPAAIRARTRTAE